MIVSQLIEALNKMPKDALVLTYSELAEEWGETEKVTETLNKEDFPYCKGDGPNAHHFPAVCIAGPCRNVPRR